jgi:hypothetical protein
MVRKRLMGGVARRVAFSMVMELVKETSVETDPVIGTCRRTAGGVHSMGGRAGIRWMVTGRKFG